MTPDRLTQPDENHPVAPGRRDTLPAREGMPVAGPTPAGAASPRGSPGRRRQSPRPREGRRSTSALGQGVRRDLSDADVRRSPSTITISPRGSISPSAARTNSRRACRAGSPRGASSARGRRPPGGRRRRPRQVAQRRRQAGPAPRTGSPRVHRPRAAQAARAVRGRTAAGTLRTTSAVPRSRSPDTAASAAEAPGIGTTTPPRAPLADKVGARVADAGRPGVGDERDVDRPRGAARAARARAAAAFRA